LRTTREGIPVPRLSNGRTPGLRLQNAICAWPPHCSVVEVMTTTALRLVGRRAMNKRSIRTAMVLARILRSVRPVICGLLRHEMLVRFEADRMCLQCLRCGAQTRGWVIDVNPAFRRRTDQGARARTTSPARLAKAS
jgi:hypothetical protein